MADSRLFETMRTFSPKEQESFVLFLKSPFFVREEAAGEMLGLYALLQGRMTADFLAKSDKQSLHEAIFPKKPYSEDRINRALARLGQLAEQFLLHHRQKEHADGLQQKIDLAGIFRTRGAYALTEKKLREAYRMTRQNTQESLLRYRLQFQLAYEDYEWKAINFPTDGNLNIPNALHQLQLYYQALCTELLNHLLMQQRAAPEQIQQLEQLILNFGIQHSPLAEQYPALKIYLKIQHLLLREEAEKEAFYTLMDLIEEHEHEIAPEVIHEFYAYLRNYCTILTNQGYTDMYEVLHTIQLDNLRRGYLYYNGHILPNALLNITRTGLLAQKQAVVRQIVEDHRYKILSDYEQEELYRINLAFCFFGEKKFEEAAEHLAFPTKTFFHLLVARRLEVMIHYELKSDLLPYKIDAFRKFVERTTPGEISLNLRKQHIHFANIVLQLSQSRIKDSKRSLLILKRIEGISKLAERVWLIEKAKNLA